jgi:hypothetical protein
MRSVAGQDDDLDRVVLHRGVERGVEVVGHLQVLRVARLGSVHHDPRDPRFRPLHDDGFELHGLAAPFYCCSACCLFQQMIGKGHQPQNEHSGSPRVDTPDVIPGQPAGLNPESRGCGLRFPVAHLRFGALRAPE